MTSPTRFGVISRDQLAAVFNSITAAKVGMDAATAGNVATITARLLELQAAGTGVYAANSALLTGTVTSFDKLPTTATDGQAYLSSSSGNVYLRANGRWSYQYQLYSPAPPAMNSMPTSGGLTDKIRGAGVTLSRRALINRARYNLQTRHLDAETTISGTNLIQIHVFNSAGTKVITGPLQEIPEVGWHEVALPPTALDPGVYYVVVSTNNTTTMRLGRADYAGGVEMAQAWPAPATLTTTAPSISVPSVALLPADPPKLVSGGAYTQLPVVVYGLSVVSGVPYAYKSSTGKLVKSNDGGTTWLDVCPWPTLDTANGDSCIDLIVIETYNGNAGVAFMLTNRARISRSSDLSATATWTEITPPQKHVNAAGRPYALNYMVFSTGGTPYIMWNEYSNAPYEINGMADGRWPACHRYDINTGIWVISGFFAYTRHTHSGLPHINNAYYLSCGDARLGDGVGSTPGTIATGQGIYRLLPSGLGVANGAAADTWVRYTGGLIDGYTDHYPVDFVRLLATDKRGAGLYCASDRPGYHIFQVKSSGVVGKFNINVRCYQQNTDLGETVRSIAEDPATNNLMYFTAETAQPGFYASPPPYSQTFKIYSFPGAISIMRLVISNGSAMQHIHRFELPRFDGQQAA